MNRNGGGVAIVIHRSMTYSTLRDFKLKVIESLGIELETSFGKIMIAHADFDSDHLPVTFSLSHEAVTRPNSSVFNYHKANWERYQHHIENNLNHDFVLETKADIDSALESLTNAILDARNIAIPKVQVKFDSPIIDDDLQLLIRLKKSK